MIKSNPTRKILRAIDFFRTICLLTIAGFIVTIIFVELVDFAFGLDSIKPYFGLPIVLITFVSPFAYHFYSKTDAGQKRMEAIRNSATIKAISHKAAETLVVLISCSISSVPLFAAAMLCIHLWYKDQYVFLDCTSNFDNNLRCNNDQDTSGSLEMPSDWYKIKVNVENQKILVLDYSTKDNSLLSQEFLNKCAIIDDANWSCTDSQNHQFQKQGGNLIEIGGPDFLTVSRDSFSGIAFFIFMKIGAGYRTARYAQEFFDRI